MKIPADWLTERVESAPTTYRPTYAGEALHIRMTWQRLRATAAEGDQVWAWATPQGLWKKHGRLSGFALVRDGEVRQSLKVTGG